MAGVLIICKNSKILLGLDYNGKFADFGGHQEDNMTLAQTASKELFEESSMLFSIPPNILKQAPHIDIHNRYRCYLIRLDVTCNRLISEFMTNHVYFISKHKETIYNEISLLIAISFKKVESIPLRSRTKKILEMLSNHYQIMKLPIIRAIKIVHKKSNITTYFLTNKNN